MSYKHQVPGSNPGARTEIDLKIIKNTEFLIKKNNFCLKNQFWGYFLDIKIGSVLMSTILFFAPILILRTISPLTIKLSTDKYKKTLAK